MDLGYIIFTYHFLGCELEDVVGGHSPGIYTIRETSAIKYNTQK